MIYLIAPYSLGDYHTASLDEAINYLRSQKTVGLDLETTGLDPVLNTVVMLQIGTADKQFVIDTRHINPKPLQDILEDPGIAKVMVNGKFDYKFLVSHYGIRLEGIVDCMLQEKILLGGREGKVSLEALSQKYTSFSYTSQLSLFEETLSKDVRKEFLTLGVSEFSTSQVLYGAYDVILPLQIHQEQQKLLQQTGMEFCAELENEYTASLADVEYNGFYMDPDKWKLIGEKVKLELADALQELNNWVITNGYEEYKDINWNSTKQVSKLFKELGVPIEIVDKKKTIDPEDPVYKDSLQRDIIDRYKNEFDIVKLYLTYKTLAKAVNTYGDKFLQNVHPVTGRIHSNYQQILNTGRMSSTSPNLQNIKRDSDYRQCFVPQDNSYVLVVADYAAQESRVMGDMAREEHMIDFFVKEGGDIHSFTAEKMFKTTVTKDINSHLRFRAKTLNFGIPYGMSAHKLARDFQIPLSEAEDVIDKWFAAYPGLADHFRKVKSFVRENGFIVIDPITNRRYYPGSYDIYLKYKQIIAYYKARGYEIPKSFWSGMYTALGKMEREAQNYPIQGTGASMTKYAVVLFRRYIRANDLWNHVKVVNIVHDEIVIECKQDLSSEVSFQIKRCMEDAGKLFCKYIPMEATPEITKTWKH